MSTAFKSRLSSLVNQMRNNHNSPSALLNKGKQEKQHQPEEQQNHYELNSDSMREAELLFNIPMVTENKEENKMKDDQIPEAEIKSILRSEKMVPEESDKKSKTVSFYEEGRPIYLLDGADKKWKDKVKDQKKGKFQPQEQKILCDAVGQFLACNEIEFDEFKRMVTDGNKGILKKQKFFKLLSSVLPKRSPESCYKFILRNFHLMNHRGPWTQEEVDKLLALVDKFGRKWKLIGKELDRTSDNVYDKYRSLGEQGLQERVKYIWKIKELVVFLTTLQNQCKTQFLNPQIKQVLQTEEEHDKQEEKEQKQRKYNSKHFVFHNIQVLCKYIDAKAMKSIDLQSIKWKKIVREIPTKSTYDCRNKFVQILQVLFKDNQDLDEVVLEFLQKQNVKDESKINWKKWKNDQFSAEEARNRFMIMKKMIEGRSMKAYPLVLAEMRSKINKRKDPKLQN